MWVVRNLLRGTLVFRALLDGKDLEIPAKSEFDLDCIGREKAEQSNQVQVAFEEGYLHNVYKEPPRGEAPAGLGLEDFKHQVLGEIRSMLLEEREQSPSGLQLSDVRQAIGELGEAIRGDVTSALAQARDVFETERRRVIHDTTLSDNEVKARLAFLLDQEAVLVKNFEDIGKQELSTEAEGDLLGKADLLSNM